MTQHDHQHDHKHDHKHEEQAAYEKKKEASVGVHKDWRFWAIILMLVAMVIYAMTNEESMVPGEPPGERVPIEAAE